MVERDGRNLADIKALINECHDMPPRPGSGFTWAEQIRSMATMREKWNEGKISIGMNAQAKPPQRDTRPPGPVYEKLN